MQKRYLQKLYGPIYILTIYRYRIDTITDENNCLMNTETPFKFYITGNSYYSNKNN